MDKLNIIVGIRASINSIILRFNTISSQREKKKQQFFLSNLFNLFNKYLNIYKSINKHINKEINC